MEDRQAAGREFGEEFEAVLRVRAEGIEAAERSEGDGDGGLEAGDAHA
jgi:hypothetical protein